MEIELIFITIGIIIGCIFTYCIKDTNYFLNSFLFSLLMLLILPIITLFSPTYSTYKFHTVYTNNMKATITVKARQDYTSKYVTLTAGKELPNITAKTLNNDYSTGTLTASKGKGQITKDYEQLIVKGSENATKISKIEYGTETRYSTIVGLKHFNLHPRKYETVRITLSETKDVKDLSTLFK